MEKGNTRSSSTKTGATDWKVKQDAANKFPRLPRHKESVSPRPETRRKPNPQRSRELFDKRPRNRTGAICEKYRSEIAEGSVCDPHIKQGGKKVNLNHLLNFTLAPIDNREVVGRRATYNRNKHPKYNKELFLQANCQFVTKEEGNYSVHLENPDILVEWSLIEEIHLPSYEVPLCPICLYTPVAAKITKCGHVYCWPCILHYLALTDRTWQKCPICFDAVHKTELKSVSLKLTTPFGIGQEITMRLMKREKKSLLPVPASHKYPIHLVCNIGDDNTVTRFQKLLLASKSQIYDIIKRERSELNEAYMKEKETPEVCFIEEALKLLNEREANLLNNDPEKPEGEVEKQTIAASTNINEHLISGRQYTISQSSDNQESSQDETSQIEDVNSSATDSNDCSLLDNSIVSQVNANLDTEKKENCYFYQAEDGQHIFLHNINVRMLIKEFGSLENAPDLIKANIMEIERVSMTEALRKRLRYLKHLPLTCEFQVVELNFSSVLSRPTIQQFEAEINKRKHFRNRKARDERRREKYIEEEENKKLGKYPRATYNLRSTDQFPAYDPRTDFQPQLSPSYVHESANMYKELGSIRNENLDGSNAECYEKTDAEAPTASFAQMLREGHAKAYTPVPVSNNKVDLVQQTVDSDEEGWVPPPEYHQSFSDAIQAALDSAISQDNISAENQKSSKKKKGKKKLLFTTSMCRNK